MRCRIGRREASLSASFRHGTDGPDRVSQGSTLGETRSDGFHAALGRDWPEESTRQKDAKRCHTGSHSLESRPTLFTFADFAANLWDHSFRVPGKPAPLVDAEMEQLVSYLVSMQFFEERGDLERGRKVYERKALRVVPRRSILRGAGPFCDGREDDLFRHLRRSVETRSGDAAKNARAEIQMAAVLRVRKWRTSAPIYTASSLRSGRR